MKSKFYMLLALPPLILFKTGIVFAQDPVYPPQTITCTFSQPSSTPCTGYDPRYLMSGDVGGLHEDGTYTFINGGSNVDTKNPSVPVSPVIYTYINASGASTTTLITTYSGIIADVDEGAWTLKQGTLAPYYWCDVSAAACPYTNTPYLKKKN